MSKAQEGAQLAGDETISEVRKAQPTAVTLVVHSTPLYQNDVLFYRTMDQCLARWNVVRIIAEEGAAAAKFAALWCKRQKVRLTVVVHDRNFAERDDRARRWRYMVEERPHLALFFNGADRWLEAARTLHAGGVPVHLVRPSEHNGPVFIGWTPGMTDVPATPSMKEVARNARRGRGRRRLSPEVAKDRQDEAKRLYRERQRLKKDAMDPHGLAFGVLRRRGRPRGVRG